MDRFTQATHSDLAYAMSHGRLDRNEDGSFLAPADELVECGSCGRLCGALQPCTWDPRLMVGSCCAVASTAGMSLDYADGGELQCGVCRKPCYRHYRNTQQNDVGECCVRKVA